MRVDGQVAGFGRPVKSFLPIGASEIEGLPGASRMSEPNAESRRLSIPSFDGYGPLVLIRRGGSASTYHSHDLRTDRPVTIKITDVAELSPVTLRRFERELKAIESLSGHPNIVTVRGGGTTPDGKPYVVTDLADGGSATERLRRRKPVPAVEVVGLGQELLAALGAAHEIGILHRDITPDNLVFSPDGRPQFADFAIVSIAGGHRTRSGTSTVATAFTAPEVLSGRRAEKTSDLYSLAATLAALAIGWPVASRGSTQTSANYVHRILRDPTRSLEPYGVSRELSDVLRKGMATTPAGRYPSAAAFLDALNRVPEAASAGATTASTDATDATDEDSVDAGVDPPVDVLVTPPVDPAIDDAPRRGPRKAVLIAMVAVLVVAAAVTTVALWPGASPSKVAAAPSAPRSPVADVSSSPHLVVVLPPAFTNSCTGRRCTFTFAATNVPAGQRLTWRFGDGTTRTGPARVSHLYRAPGTYTAVLIASRSGRSAASKPVPISITRLRRALLVRAGQVGTSTVNVAVTGSTQCRPANYTLERGGTPWHRVRSGRITSTVTTLRVPGASRYRLDLAEIDRQDGFCAAARSAPVTVRAAAPAATSPTSTPTPTKPTPTTPAPTRPAPTTGAPTPPAPVKYTPPPVH